MYAYWHRKLRLIAGDLSRFFFLGNIIRGARLSPQPSKTPLKEAGVSFRGHPMRSIMFPSNSFRINTSINLRKCCI